MKEWKGGGGSETTYPWIKTTKSSPKREIGRNPYRLFFVAFFEIGKGKKNFGGGKG